MSSGPKGKSVLWASNNVQHIVNYTSTPSKSRSLPHNSVSTPKSILRKFPQAFPGSTEFVSVRREGTPEPNTPAEDSNYLSGPVDTIVAGTDSLSNIVEAYNHLCTRLKTMHQSIATINPKAPFPALKPIIDNKNALVAACDRDMRRALVNPRQGNDENRPFAEANIPKKGGMSDEEAKGARDMHLACLAALRFTSLLLSSLQLEGLFSAAQLLELLTAVLAIPLAPALPSLNCRKTYAIATGVLAAASLTRPVATEAASRITFALRRAIEGELGREGKRGSIADGLKAIREYILQHPHIFMSEFAALLSGLFSQLTGSSKVNRMLAAQVLGAIASVSHIATCESFRSDIDSILGEAYQTLVKDLRAALSPDSLDGPWALCTLAAIVTLTHGSPRAAKLAMNVLPVAMIHKKTGIRMMGSLVWRCYAKEALLKGLREGDSAWQLLMQVLPMNVGLGLVAALTSENQSDLALKILTKMVAKGGVTCAEAVPMLQRITSFDLEPTDQDIKDLSCYIPSELFDGTLLFNPYSNIGSALQKVMGNSIDVRAIRPLSKSEVRSYWSILQLVWRDAAIKAEVGSDGEMPKDLAEIWRLLLSSRVKDNEEVLDEKELQTSLVEVMAYFLTNSELIWSSSCANALSSNSLKYGFVTNLWSIARESIPASTLETPAMEILPRILQERPDKDSVAAWAELVAHITVLTPNQQCLQVLEYVRSRASQDCNELRSVWNVLMSAWTSAEGSWEDGLSLLAFPCRNEGLDADHDIEEQVWEECMRISFMKAQGANVPVQFIVDVFANNVISGDWHPFLPRFTELILRHVSITQSTMPALVQLCVNALIGAYESGRSNVNVLLKSRWLIREITRQLDTIEPEELISFLYNLQPGLATWVRDEFGLFNDADYAFEIGNCFENILLNLKFVSSHKVEDILRMLAPLFASAFEGADLNHSTEPCADLLTAYFECVCLDVPISEWPPIFIPRIRDLPAFISAFKIPAGGNCEPLDTVSESQNHNLEVLSGLNAIASFSRDAFTTPRKRRHSEPDVFTSKKRKRAKVCDENCSPTIATRLRPRRSLPDRTPFKAIEIEQHTSPLEPPTKPTQRLSGNPRKGQRWIMDCVCLPTLAQYERERGIVNGSRGIHQQVSQAIAPLLQTPAQNFSPQKLPNSDDTLVGEDDEYLKGDRKSIPMNKDPLSEPISSTHTF